MANNNIIDSTDDRPGDNEHSEDDMAVDLEGGGNATSANEGNNTNNNNNNSPIAPPTAGAPPAARESAAASRYDDTDSDEESANRVPSPINNHNTNNTTHSDSDNDDSDDDNDDSDEDSNAADRLRTNNNREIIPAAAAVVEQPMLALGQDDTTGTVAHIRGTDVHVPTAAAAFADFLQTFVSLRHSQQANQRHQQQQQTRRRRRNPSRRDGTENDDDASSLASSNSSDDEEDPPVEATVVGGVPFYTTKLRALLLHTNSEETASLAMDTMHLFYHNAECQRLYHQLVQYPMELVPLMDLLVQRELERLLLVLANENEDDEVDMEDRILPRVQVRPYNLQSVSNLRELDPVCMDTLVCCKGMIVRSSPIIPDLKVAHFGCSICGETATVTIDRGRIAEPANRCPTCHTANAWQIQHNRCVFADKQLVRLQETPDEVPAGQTPASVVTFCFDDLVDSVQPGDKVEVTGVLRAQPVRVNPKISKVKAVYKTYLDVIHFRSVTGMESNILRHNPDSTSSTTPSSSSSGKESQWTEQRIQELRDLSRDADIYQKLTDSLAPSIWELDNCKKGILCMLFGGNHVRVKRGTAAAAAAAASTTRATNAHEQNWIDQHDDDDDDMHDNANDHVVAAAASAAGGSSTSKLNKRGDINILLCGDPGTSKSQLLSYVNKLSTRGVYTSGKGSSAVGLTASVVRDPETRDLVLESGALVLSDQGICCIDEFDKMSDTTRSVLHEAMEQQTVSIAKAGIIATLHARTSVLASANPSESRYNPNRSVVDNIQLPPTLLSRFDLIYLILDAPNVERDRRLAQHLVGLYYETPNVVEPPLDQVLLRDYIEYARKNIHPEISDEAAAQLVDSYLEMRNPSGGAISHGTRTISATARQLESLIRISEALAKMRYSVVVTRADVCEAVRLMKVATQAAATDPRTGRIDMDMITTGRSSNTRQLEEQIDLSLKELLQERRGKRLAVRDVTRQLTEINNAVIPQEDVVEGLRRMHADGVIQFNERGQTIFVRSGVIG